MFFFGCCVAFLQKISEQQQNSKAMSLDWPNQPTLLLGRKIEVEWKQGKMYKGKVTSYNSFTKRFTIVYEDNEEKEYDMFTKTFKIVRII
jgi:hypothetical protein